MEVFSKSDIGLVRTQNQDDFRFGVISPSCVWAVVCDGMGGANGGNIASAMACEAFVAAVEQFVASDKVRRGHATEGDFSSMLAHAVAGANLNVYKATERDKSLRGMGTTLVAALVVGDVLYAVNVGDSRLYLYSRGRLTQITRDHSLVQYLMDTGKLTQEEAKDYPNRNVITRAVGIERNIEADIFSVDLSRLGGGTCALLCSDGLSGYVANEDILRLLTEGGVGKDTWDGEAAAAALVDAANEAGGADNVTVVLMALDDKKTNNSEVR